MSRKLIVALSVLFIAAALAWLLSSLLRSSAREAPTAAEEFIGRSLRAWSIPSAAREAKNPFVASPELLDEATHHFADHCASCHGNDGSGATEMGRNFYPRVPDMRAGATQHRTDGELYYSIHNGIRWTGMPAWGDPDHDTDSWKLVLFIRRLPQLTPEEIRGMERFNPKSPAEMQEEKEEEEFLNGGPAPAITHEHHHPEK